MLEYTLFSDSMFIIIVAFNKGDLEIFMEKTINLSKSVYEIIKDYPDIAEIMRELGFENITNPAMLNTAGRFMTIPKGASMKNIPLDRIKEVLKTKGYEVQE